MAPRKREQPLPVAKRFWLVKQEPLLRQSRLSVMPVSTAEFACLIELGGLGAPRWARATLE